MKLERLREIVAKWSAPRILERDAAVSLLADIDAEIAKARGEHLEGAAWALMVVRRLGALERGQIHGVASDNDQDKRLAALEASEVALREHCQGSVPMSVFNDLKKRVDSLFSDTNSLENATTRELRALAERVKALEPKSLAAEDDAWDDWRELPWGESGLETMAGGRVVYAEKAIEAAFRAGFRAGRK